MCLRSGTLLDIVIGLETIELIEKFEHRPLYFTIAGLLAVETLRSNSVQFVNENDRRRLFLGQCERIAN